MPFKPAPQDSFLHLRTSVSELELNRVSDLTGKIDFLIAKMTAVELKIEQMRSVLAAAAEKESLDEVKTVPQSSREEEISKYMLPKISDSLLLKRAEPPAMEGISPAKENTNPWAAKLQQARNKIKEKKRSTPDRSGA
mgnify:CR=1 FL=1